MPFAPGDHVLVTSLGKGIVREVRRGGRYLVEIKGRSLLVPEEQLSPFETRKRRPVTVAPEEREPADEAAAHLHASGSLDLHGMTTDEATSALDSLLNDAILAGHSEVRVIHGRSGGRLKMAVHSRLKVIRSVRAFRLDPRNPGVTIIDL